MISNRQSILLYIAFFLLGTAVSGGIFYYALTEKLASWDRQRTARQILTPVRHVPTTRPAPQGTVPVSEAAFSEAADQAVNAVVYINTQGHKSNGTMGLHRFFEGIQRSSGSGVILSKKGHIVTNYHVIEHADEVVVTLNDNTRYEAEILATDPNTDLAVLKIDPDAELHTMKMGNSDGVRVGQWVLAVGNPFSLTSTVTAGIVSAKARNIGILRSQLTERHGHDYSIESFIQTDAAVNPGNSGGALVGMDGTLIGINTAIATETGMYSGYSFAIPVNLVRKVVGDLIEHGAVQRGFIGVSIQNVDPGLAEEYNLPTVQGAFVSGLTANGAAAQAGILKGDVIIAIEEAEVLSATELQERVALYSPGQRIRVTLLRDGQKVTLPVTLRNIDGTFDPVEPELTQLDEDVTADRGVWFGELETSALRELDLEYGIAIAELTESNPLYEAGLRTGMIITRLNDRVPESIPDLKRQLREDGPLLIEVIKPNRRKHYYLYNPASGYGSPRPTP